MEFSSKIEMDYNQLLCIIMDFYFKIIDYNGLSWQK